MNGGTIKHKPRSKHKERDETTLLAFDDFVFTSLDVAHSMPHWDYLHQLIHRFETVKCLTKIRK